MATIETKYNVGDTVYFNYEKSDSFIITDAIVVEVIYRKWLITSTHGERASPGDSISYKIGYGRPEFYSICPDPEVLEKDLFPTKLDALAFFRRKIDEEIKEVLEDTE